MAVELRPLTQDNYKQAFDLEVAPEQSDYVAPNVISIAEAYFWKDSVRPDGIFADDEMVGFSLYTHHAPFSGGRWVIVRFMIDHRQQGKGYGKAAMRWLIDFFRAKPDCDRVYLSVMPENIAAKRLYESVGFQPTGKFHGNEAEYVLMFD